MNNHQVTNNVDFTISNCISNWENEPLLVQNINTKKMVRYLIVPSIYSALKNKTKKKNNLKYSIKKIIYLIENVIWGVLWCLISFLFAPSIMRKNKLCLLNIGYKNKYSSFIINDILNLDPNYRIITLKLIKDRKILLSGDVIYFPHSIIKHITLFGDGELKDKFKNELNKLGENISANFGLIKWFDKDIIAKWIKLIRVSKIYSMLLSLKTASRIKFVLQDYDDTNDNYALTIIAKNKSIKTFVIDHSLPIYDHLIEPIFSDYAFVWGEYKKNKLLKLNNVYPLNIVVVGKYSAKESIIFHNQLKKRKWLYLLGAFNDPSYESYYRTEQLSISIIKKIQNYIENNNKKIELLIKSHPNDYMPLGHEFNYTNTEISQIISQIDLVIFEDTTYGLEFLNYNIPLVYVLNSLNDNPLNIPTECGVELLSISENITLFFQNIQNKKIDLDKRKNLAKYYFDGKSNFKKYLPKYLS